MALSKIEAEGINLADTFAFTGTVTGAGLTSPFGNTVAVTSEGGAATTNLVQGLAKMWATINQSSFSVLDSINVSSASDDGTGQFTVTRSNNMNNSNYGVATACMGDRVGLLGSQGSTYNTSQNNFTVNDSRDASYNNPDRNGIILTGDLA